MADAIPAFLRQADPNIYKCASKAAQLQSVKPIVSYWCEYWVVNQILARQLHTKDEDVLRYTTHLMDKLEQTKTEYAHEDAIIDDTAGQAYVEQFAQETLDRAERVVKANKVTQQTAVTFDAAATFFQLVNIWGTPDEETQQKIKYAKWNAARIAKALREGADPNETNPKPQDIPQQPALDPSDPEVRLLDSASGSTGPRPVTIEDVPEDNVRRDAAGVSLPQSPASAGPSPTSDGGLNLPGVPTELAPPAGHSGYYDQGTIPSPVSPPSHDSQAPPDLPLPPSGWPQSEQGPNIPSAPTGWPSQPPPPASGWQPSQNPYYQPPAPPVVPPTFAPSPPPTAAVASPPAHPPMDSFYTNTTPTTHTTRPPPQAAPRASYVPAPPPDTVDEAAMVNAQKHAKWAISALNFEDVNTAVRELRRALELLGAT
ncbi:hypothetical protein OQA88_1784 [Cercophora sp. LCS_1]